MEARSETDRQTDRQTKWGREVESLRVDFDVVLVGEQLFSLLFESLIQDPLGGVVVWRGVVWCGLVGWQWWC